nr:hypothetical protein [uncultured Faecalibacillus sp.]
MNDELKAILDQMELCIEDDEITYEFNDLIEKISDLNLGLSSIEPLLHFIEKHPLIDFGFPGEIVHYLEKFYKQGYEEKLISSLNRKPTRHTVFMLNRLINGTTHKEDYLLLMNDIVHRNDVEQEIKDDVQEFLDFQKEME